MTALLFLLGLGLLVGGAELLVRGAARLAFAMGITPLVVGLTVVAFGTSAPELAVTVAAIYRGDPELALGNVVGSNIMNVLLILGVSAVIAPLMVRQRVVRVEVPLVMAVSVLVLVLALDGRIGRLEGALLLCGGFLYTAILIRNARRVAPERPMPAAAVLGRGTPRGRTGVDVLFVSAGLVTLVLGSRWLVASARSMADSLGISELAIGLTIVAIGTSLPELATSVVATMRGERDIAVGNIIGSNLFNLLVVLGAGAAISPDGVAAAAAAIAFDIPVMIAVSVVCLPVFFTDRGISRLEGVLFLLYFAAYTTYVLLRAYAHPALPDLRDALLYVALPLTALALTVSAVRQLRR